MPGYIKPMRLGVLTKCTPHEGGAIFTVTSLAFFDLLEPDYLLVEIGLWPTAADQLPPGSLLDFGTPKPNAEVIVAGSAIPPGGNPTGKLLVEARVGPISKKILAVGNRHWVRGDHGPVFTDPVPFTHIPIVPELAFGGEGFEANPVGRGIGSRGLYEAGYQAPLPNLEDPARPILTIDDTPPPAWFGPYGLDAPWRRKYMGTFDQRYMKTHFPGYPEDFDTRYFLTAPDDQQIDGYFRGDEEIYVSGMSSTHPQVHSRLPGIRGRAFVYRSSEPAGLQELTMKLDTVWVFGSVNKGLAAFRGSTWIEDIEGDDVKDVMIAYERLDEEPRSHDHYAEVYRLRKDPDEKVKYLLADYQLSPAIDPEIKEARRQRKLADFQKRMEAFSAAQEFSMRKQYEQHDLPLSLVPKIPLPPIPPVAIPTREELDRGEADFAELLDDLEEQKKFADTVLVEAEALRKDMIEKSGMDGLKGLPSLYDIVPNIQADPKYAGAFSDVSAPDIDRTAAIADLESLVADMPSLAERSEEEQAKVQAGLEQARGLLSGAAYNDPANFLADEDEQFRMARARALDLPEARPMHDARSQIRDAVERMEGAGLEGLLAESRETFEQDKIADAMERMRQSGMDPDEIDQATQRLGEAESKLSEMLPILKSDTPGEGFDRLLSEIASVSAERERPSPDEMVREFEAMFDLMEPMVIDGKRKSRLIALEAAVPQPPLSPAVARRLGDLVRTEIGLGNLAGRDLAGADLAGADLSGADLTGTLLEGANLQGANLSGVTATEAAFTGANLRGANLSGSVMEKVNFASAKLDGASFAGARIVSPNLMLASLEEVRLENADLVRWTVAKQDFCGVVLDGAKLTECTFMRCTFDRASARRAQMVKAVFIEGSAIEARFDGAEFEKCGFIKVPLDRAVFDEAQLLETGFIGEPSMQQASFAAINARKTSWFTADLSESCFLRAQMRDCNLMMSNFRHSDFRLSTLRDTLMMRADYRECDFFGANLLGAQMRKANLSFASLRKANAYGADFSLAKLTGTDLHDAHLIKTAFRAPETVD
ncbi:DUF2169 domain-containing protein [Amorphus orientalis]|uniref:Uncharacterized protein YjbI with pentapeptide repeats n=1 Tax=Amorphus orientalis TaxID=649198 RepID=A0AAE3VLM3_9HYPH|nr:DUF2169 domain-containing protein [Amorphus orientalis]MDQ0314285.1 uncharacterized protein YjbI with pentapeptide repeats [Amorphus orientalis]